MQRTDDMGKLVLRLCVGILILMHGLYKLINGPAGIIALVSANGWPAWVGYLVLVGEVLAPALIIIGLFTRLGAFIIFVNMIAAVYLAHGHQILNLGTQGGYMLELQAMFLFGALAVMLLGAGQFSLAGSRGKLN